MMSVHSILWRNVLRATEWFVVMGLLAVAAWGFFVGSGGDDPLASRVATESGSVPDLIQPGATLDWEGLLPGEERNVVLLMRTTCPFSDEDTEFYRAMAARARETEDAHFVVVSDELPETVRRWLEGRAIGAGHLAHGRDGPDDLYSLGVFGTPTVVATNEHGVVTDVMVGVLSPREEERFLTMLSGGDDDGVMNNLPDPRLVDHETFTRVASEEKVQLLDVRDRAEYRRGHDQHATNIPADELSIRARVEMAGPERLFVDCRVGVQGDCRNAARLLVFNGFRHVAVIVP